jgi:chromosome segregation ATPase
MGIGGTAKKLQKVAEMAEDVYARLNELREQLAEMRETAQDTRDRVDRLETENAEQRALLEALAEREGIDVETVTANAHIKEAETDESNAAADDPSDGATAGEAVDGGDDAQTEN